MSVRSVMDRIRLEVSDITEAKVDAIVNAANSELKLGSGVAGAVRVKGGPSIQAECDAIGPIELGSAAITGGGDLAATYVIHAASMRLGGSTSEDSLRSSVRRSLEIANEKGLRSIAFPAVGTGVGALSLQRCAEIMLEEARRHLDAGTSLEEIRFVLFEEQAYRVFEQVQDAARIQAQLDRMRR
jgi:O-acetyl-ADP-ribose deacetylase (regulator of RNase III)